MTLRYPLMADGGEIRPVFVTVEIYPAEVIGGQTFYPGSVDVLDVIDAFTSEPVFLSEDDVATLDRWLAGKVRVPVTEHAAWW